MDEPIKIPLDIDIQLNVMVNGRPVATTSLLKKNNDTGETHKPKTTTTRGKKVKPCKDCGEEKRIFKDGRCEPCFREKSRDYQRKYAERRRQKKAAENKG